MTSFIIKAHEGRSVPSTWAEDVDCAFCRVIKGELPTSKVYENEKVIAILGEPQLFSHKWNEVQEPSTLTYVLSRYFASEEGAHSCHPKSTHPPVIGPTS